MSEVSERGQQETRYNVEDWSGILKEIEVADSRDVISTTFESFDRVEYSTVGIRCLEPIDERAPEG